MLFFSPADPHRRRRLIHLLISWSRQVDDVADLGGNRVGLLLPETSSSEARKAQSRLIQLLRNASIDCLVKTYTYGGSCEHPDQCGQVHCAGNCIALGLPRGTAQGTWEITTREDANAATASSKDLDDAAIGVDSGLWPFLLPPISWWKRGLDIVGSLTLLVLLSPVMAAVAVAVRLSSPGPVIFRQKRVGRGGRLFCFYKFRSMYADAEARKKDLEHLNEAQGPVFKMTNDPRITPVGRFIRKTSLDELPQLWNVLRGDMSLVGPRPPIPSEVRQYALWHRRRLEVPGGLTCIWQVSGRCEIPFEEWMRMDLRYTRQQSLWMDLVLLWRTIGAVLSRRGAK